MVTKKIVWSSEGLTPRERMKLGNLTAAKKLEEFLDKEITVVAAMKMEVTNDKLEEGPKTYDVFIMCLEDGVTVYTSSSSFMDAFMDIYSQLEECGEKIEMYPIKAFGVQSKNQQGKFYSCAVV